jgi:hypothetical protein
LKRFQFRFIELLLLVNTINLALTLLHTLFNLLSIYLLSSAN